MNTDNLDGINLLTEKIIGCAMKVSGTLGSGFLEKVYENAISIELRDAGLIIEQQKLLHVLYRGAIVGEFCADIVVNEQIIVDLKAAKAIDEIHQAQLLNYLKATGFRVGLLLNFGTPRLGIKRMML